MEEEEATEDASCSTMLQSVAIQTEVSCFDEASVAIQTDISCFDEASVAIQTDISCFNEASVAIQTDISCFDEASVAIQTDISCFDEASVAIQTDISCFDEVSMAIQTDDISCLGVTMSSGLELLYMYLHYDRDQVCHVWNLHQFSCLYHHHRNLYLLQSHCVRICPNHQNICHSQIRICWSNTSTKAIFCKPNKFIWLFAATTL